MPPLAESFFQPADAVDRNAGGLFLGRRCAVCLGASLLALLALTTAARWLTPAAASSTERIIQQPIVPETSTFSSQTPDVTAPDPGDAPP